MGMIALKLILMTIAKTMMMGMMTINMRMMAIKMRIMFKYVIPAPPPPPPAAAPSPKSPRLTHYPTANTLSNEGPLHF